MNRTIHCIWVGLFGLMIACNISPTLASAAPPFQDEDLEARAAALREEGYSLLEMGDDQGAIRRFEEALSIYHDIGHSKEEALVLSDIGAIHQILGRYQQAADYYKKAIEVVRNIPDPIWERDLLNLTGGVYSTLKQYQQALEYYEQALALSQETNDRAGEWAARKNIGTLYSDMGQYEQALAYYGQALAIAQEMDDKSNEGKVLNNIGATYDTLGQYSQSVNYLEQALAIHQKLGDRIEEATTLNNIATLYLHVGQYSLARDYARQSLTICQEFGHRVGEAKSLHNIGGSYFSSGQYLSALDYYQQALAIEQETHADPITEGTTINNIGLVYAYLGQYPQALDYLQRALTMRDKVGAATTLNNIGAVYTKQGKYPEALDHYQEALAIQQTIGDRSGEAATLNNIGLTYTTLGQPSQAIDYFQQALLIQKEIGSQTGRGSALNNIGQAYFELSQYTQALDYYQQALELEQKIDDRPAEAITLSNLGFFYEQQNNNTEAILHFQQAIKLIELIQSEIKVEELKISFVEEKIDAYAQLINLLWDQNRFEEAFSYTERARARAFLDELANQTIDFRTGAGAALLERERMLRSEIAVLRAQLVILRNEGNDDETAKVAEALADREADYTQLLTDIKLQSPEVAGLVSVDVASLVDVQNLLDTNTTLIEYFVMEDRTLAFIITHDTFETVGVDVSQEDLAQTIHGFRDFASLDDSHPATLKQLYTWLVAPLKDKLQTPIIGIIPHGTLHYLPFTALTDGERYLGNEYSLFTLPSASALRFIQEKRKPQTETILALGNPTITQPGLSPLEFAGQEVETIATMFGTEPLIGDSATESALRSQAGTAGIVHLAAHGQYNASNPLFSVIYLADDQQEDGRLEVNEIYSLDLRKATDLVVLSACETQVGAVSAGDEVVGMTRAFLYAGTPTVIASLWNVDDEATTLLMERFYKHLREGMSKAQALQAAQSELRTKYSDKYAHPYYWAAFVLTGDPGTTVPGESIPVPEPDYPVKWLIGLGGAGLLGLCCFGTVLLAAGVIWGRRRKKV